MIYAEDQWAQLPVQDLYDSGLMQMSIAAAKDMYEKSEKRIDDFYKNYGDFKSPFAKDMVEYQNMISRPTAIINELYANGIDPLRSAEGRAAVQQAIRGFSIGLFNKMKANAAVGYEYMKNKADLQKKGLFNQDFENFLLNEQNLSPFSEFSTKDGGSWTAYSPTEFKSERDIALPLVENVKPHSITAQEYQEQFGGTPETGMRYVNAITPQDLRDAIDTTAVEHTPYFKYYQNVANQKGVALEDILVNSVLDKVKRPDVEIDEKWKMRQEFAHAKDIADLRYGNDDSDDSFNHFRKAAANPGVPVAYNPRNPDKIGISPMGHGIRNQQMNISGIDRTCYELPNGIQPDSHIYMPGRSETGAITMTPIVRQGGRKITIEPTGGIIAGEKGFYIYGHAIRIEDKKDADGNLITNNQGKTEKVIEYDRSVGNKGLVLIAVRPGVKEKNPKMVNIDEDL